MKKLVLSLAMAFCCQFLSAVPVRPHKVKVTTAEDSLIEGVLKGDEHLHWIETEDGTCVFPNSENLWTLNTKKQVRTPRRKVRDSKLQVDKSFPTTGKRKLLMLLLLYQGDTPTFSYDDFNNYMNQSGYKGIGSFRDYYLEQSAGKLDIETTVTKWVTLPHGYYYYGGTDDAAVDMILDGLNIVKDSIDLTQFDNDGDGVLDGLAVIHNGEGQETSALSTDIWSHSSTISGVSVGGIELGRYTIEPELADEGVQSNIGVICHEFGHNLGAPDFYDSDYSSSGGTFFGTGKWDLMGEGIWNGDSSSAEDSGSRPAGINIWQRYMFGWCDLVNLTDDQHVADIQASSEAPVGYRLNTATEGEYFLMENRQQKGAFDKSIPGHGLIIYHVSEAKIKANVQANTLNVTHPQALYTVSANATSDPTEYVSSYGITNDASTPYPGTKGITSFSDFTLPSCKAWNGRQSFKAIENITETDGKISFDFRNVEAPEGPTDLTAEANKGTVELKWEFSGNGKGGSVFKWFNIYRDEELVSTTTDCYYKDTPGTEGVVTNYIVDAEYSDGQISPYQTANTCVPANRIKTVDYALTDDGKVRFNWVQNDTLSRTQSTDEYTETSLKHESIDICHRYTAEDLLTYKLGKIKKVGFVSLSSQNAVDIKIRIWQADRNGENATVVSEQEVTDFATATWMYINLQKPVTIMANKEYWVGINITRKAESMSIITDNGPVLEDRGSWMRIGDQAWQQSSEVDGNFWIMTVITPYEPTVSSNIPQVSEVKNPITDLLYPIGYNVYKNGQLIGQSGNSFFEDSDYDGSAATYSFSCIYKGNNESVEKKVTVGPEGINGVSEAKNSKDSEVFNLAGQLVERSYKGIKVTKNRKTL